MASARAALGKARRRMIGRQKKSDVFQGVLSTVGTVAAFAAGQAKKAGTAWEEYEAGYKELGGEGFERPKFGQKGYFKGPEGDVRIGEKMYGRENIRKAGSFLGSDAASILDPEQRQQYLGRTAPGTLAPGLGSAPATQPHIYSPTEIRDQLTSGVPFLTKMDMPIAGRTSSIPKIEDIQQVEPGPQIPETNKPLYGMSSEEVGARKTQESAWDVQRSNVNKFKNQSLEGYDAMNQYRMPSYARGGDFITNGPQKIIVGDNASGRERVTIKPLPSKDDEEYKKRSLLESLYENNRRRKIY